MPLYALQTFYKGSFWGLGKQLCTVIGAFDYINSFAEWMSVAIVALTKCINLIKPKFGEKWFSGLRGILLIASIWIYANLIVIPIHFSWVCEFFMLIILEFTRKGPSGPC